MPPSNISTLDEAVQLSHEKTAFEAKQTRLKLKTRPGPNVVKRFVCDVQIFILSYNVCYTKLEKLARDKHSSLLRKYVNYG